MKRWSKGAVVLLLMRCLAPSGIVAQEPEPPRVTIHPGIMVGTVERPTFETVRTLAGQDAFLRVDAADQQIGPTALISYRLTPIGTAALHGTVGAALTGSGQLTLIGLSLEHGRAFITGGAATTLVEEGTVPVEDEVFGADANRTLYADLSRTREWGLFVGLTFGIASW